MKVVVFLITLFWIHGVCGEIMKIEQIGDIEKIALDPGAWIFFDIDYTLIQPDHPALGNIKDRRFREVYAQCSLEQKRLLPIFMVSQVPSVLVSPEIPTTIERLKEKKHTVVGCTAADTSSLSHIGSVPQWRSRDLRRLGIVFTNKGESTQFKQFVSYRSSYPSFEDGLLYTNVTTSKGEVVLAFFDYLQERPSQVVLVDDVLDNLRSMELAMERERIPFLGLHFSRKKEEGEVSDEKWYEVWDSIYQRVREETE